VKHEVRAARYTTMGTWEKSLARRSIVWGFPILVCLGFLQQTPAALAQKVSLKYDKSVDYSKFKTYAWVQGTPVADSTLDLYIKGAVDGMLAKKELRKVAPEQADIFLTYHAATDGDVNANSFQDPTSITTGTALPGQTIWDSAPAMGASAGFIRKGTISFEIFDRSQHKLVWSSKASAKLKEKRGERFDQLDQSMIKIFAGYPPKT
jgi:hypothetical protein